MDKRKFNKGKKGNKGGRPPKKVEDHANTIFLNALKEIHDTKKDDEAKVKFVKDLYESQRGQLFIAEHLFGKPTENVNNTHTVRNTLDDIKSLYGKD